MRRLTAHERLHWYDRLLALVFRVTPKFGPLQALSIKPLTPAAEDSFAASFSQSVDRYRSLVKPVPAGQIANVNLDTGEPSRAGAYALADEAYANLVFRLRAQSFSTITASLRRNILAFYSDLHAPIATQRDAKAWRELLVALEELRATSP